ncbi:hypothetical protein [Flavobacterium maritimum]|uniref:hypothetical protein n=1 Tax=Flavobacterium maritimum TaxID=3149042 RepID=UPI0032B5130E
MKKFLLCLVLPFLVISCSTESDFNPSENSNASGPGLSADSPIPQNSSNPFDKIGKEYYDSVGKYLKNNKVPNDNQVISDQMKLIISSEELALIITDPENKLIATVERSILSREAKIHLEQFVNTLLKRQNREYKTVYNDIVSYETAIQESKTLNEQEKEIILTTTSITRYSLYAETEEHKDRDWETSVANKQANTNSDPYKASIVSVILLLRKLV